MAVKVMAVVLAATFFGFVVMVTATAVVVMVCWHWWLRWCVGSGGCGGDGVLAVVTATAVVVMVCWQWWLRW